MGVFGTFNNLFCLGYYWLNMWKMVEEVCAGCMKCLCKNVGKIGFHLLTPVFVALLMNLIAIDFVCSLSETLDGFTLGLIIIDCATCFVFLYLLKPKFSEAVVEALLEVFCNFGFPWEIQSNQNPSFINESIDKFRELAEPCSRKVLKYFPAQNGMVERYIKKVNNVLKKMMYSEDTYWVKFLPVIQLSLNDQYISHHKLMPFACMFNWKVNQVKNYKKIELEVVTLEQLLERNWNLVHVVYPALARLSAASEKLNCKLKNSERKEKKIFSGCWKFYFCFLLWFFVLSYNFQWKCTLGGGVRLWKCFNSQRCFSIWCCFVVSSVFSWLGSVLFCPNLCFIMNLVCIAFVVL